MNIKKGSKIVSILNLVFLFLICIEVIYLFFLHDTNLDSFVWSNLNIYNWINLYRIFISISLLVTAIVNIIYAIQNRENKKFNIYHLIISIFTIIFLINQYIFFGNIIYNAINFIYIIICMIATIIQLISLRHNSFTYNNENKISGLFVGLAIFSTTILLVISVIYYSLTFNEVSKRSTYKNNIENQISSNFEEYTGVTYKEIKQNGKIGYTINGKNKIPCVYTYSSGFDAICVNEKIYFLAIVVENGRYKLLSTNSKTIDLGPNPVDIAGWSDFEPLQRILLLLEDNINSVNKK